MYLGQLDKFLIRHLTIKMSILSTMAVVIKAWFILLTVGTTWSDNKRLLLNDPDVLNTRLVHLEQVLAQMNQSLQHETALRQAQDTEMAALKQKVYYLDKEVQQQLTGNGATYVRWGRKQCPRDTTELVYSGFVGGQEYYHTDWTTRYGGPANTLCLPQDPELSNVSFTNDWSTISGAEYETDLFAQGYTNRDVPCSVCRVVNKTSAVMIPGRRTCYQGWTEEYHGILASDYRGQTASTYICMDGNPEYVLHGEADQNGRLLYPVKYQCGSLPCPPYRGDRMVECVVCSK